MKKGKNGTEKGRAKGKESRSGAGRPAGRPAPERGHGKGVATSGIIILGKTTHTRKDAMKDYSMHHVPGEHLKFEDRQILARDWNRQVNNGPRPTIRGFASDHGLPAATWHREYERGKVGASVPIFPFFKIVPFNLALSLAILFPVAFSPVHVIS